MHVSAVMRLPGLVNTQTSSETATSVSDGISAVLEDCVCAMGRLRGSAQDSAWRLEQLMIQLRPSKSEPTGAQQGLLGSSPCGCNPSP